MPQRERSKHSAFLLAVMDNKLVNELCVVFVSRMRTKVVYPKALSGNEPIEHPFQSEWDKRAHLPVGSLRLHITAI